MMKRRNRTGFVHALSAPWGVLGGSTLLRSRPGGLLRCCNAAIARIFGDRIAVNDAAVEDQAADLGEITFGTAINVAPIDETQDDWINVSPYGEFPNDQGTQVVDRAAAEEMATNFNSFAGKLGRLFRGAPIYRGHPYQRPDLWPDDSRYGRVNELQARDDGLYGKVAWNDKGKQNKEQGYWVYPSPGWHFRKLTGGKIKPFALDHIGLTNNPNIFESVPLTNSRTQAAARTAEHQPNQEDNLMDRKQLIAALGLEANATDEQIMTAINAGIESGKVLLASMTAINVAKSGEFQAKLTETLTALNTAKQEAKQSLDLAINAQLDRYTDKGVITAAERDAWKTKLETNFDGTLTELKEKQPALNTKSLNLKPNGKDLSDASKRRVAFNSRLDEIMQPDRDGKSLTIDQAIQKMRSNDEDRALLDAMQQPLAA